MSTCWFLLVWRNNAQIFLQRNRRPSPSLHSYDQTGSQLFTHHGHVTQTWPISTLHPYGSFVIGSVVDTRLLGVWDPNWGCCWKSLETLFFAGVIGNQNDVRMEGLGVELRVDGFRLRAASKKKGKGRTEVLWFLFECQDSYISPDRFAPGVFRSLRQYIPFPFLLVWLEFLTLSTERASLRKHDENKWSLPRSELILFRSDMGCLVWGRP